MSVIFFNNEKQIPKGAVFIDVQAILLEELNEVKKNDGELSIINLPKLWAYYPEKKIAINILPEELYHRLHTSRNKGLISDEQQLKYRNFRVALAGNSVGFNIGITLALSGGPKFMRIADPDIIKLSNLNRMQCSIMDVGKKKCKILADRINMLDPFIKVEYIDKSITVKNVDHFLNNIDIIIDEVDSIPLKILLRQKAQERGMPLIMATDNGDSVILDVERHDKEKVAFFGGRINNMDESQYNQLNQNEWLKMANKIIGFNDLTNEMKKAISEIGKTIYHVPQLGTASTMAGSVVAYAVRLIANNEELQTGRYIQKIYLG